MKRLLSLLLFFIAALTSVACYAIGPTYLVNVIILKPKNSIDNVARFNLNLPYNISAQNDTNKLNALLSLLKASQKFTILYANALSLDFSNRSYTIPITLDFMPDGKINTAYGDISFRQAENLIFHIRLNLSGNNQTNQLVINRQIKLKQANLIDALAFQVLIYADKLKASS